MFPHDFQIEETAGAKGLRSSEPLWGKKKKKLMWQAHALGREWHKARLWKQKDSVGTPLSNGKEFRINSKCMKLLEDFKQEWEYRISLILVFQIIKQGN